MAEVEHQTKFRPSAHIPASLGPLQGIVNDRRVYIRNSDGREELYDFEHDPDELENLAGTADARLLLDALSAGHGASPTALAHGIPPRLRSEGDFHGSQSTVFLAQIATAVR